MVPSVRQSREESGTRRLGRGRWSLWLATERMYFAEESSVPQGYVTTSIHYNMVLPVGKYFCNPPCVSPFLCFVTMLVLDADHISYGQRGQLPPGLAWIVAQVPLCKGLLPGSHDCLPLGPQTPWGIWEVIPHWAPK